MRFVFGQQAENVACRVIVLDGECS
jgi:hypothetical protein